MDINVNQITNLFRSLESNWGIGGSSGKANSGCLISKVSQGQMTTMQISAFSRQINDIHQMVVASDNQAAVAGFRDLMTTLSGDAANTDLYNFINMGAAALQSEDSGFIVDLMAGYNNLRGQFGAETLAREMAVEAGATYEQLGLDASRTYSQAAAHIVEAGERGGVSVQDALRDYMDAWRQVRSADMPTEDRRTEAQRLGQGVLGQRDTVDIQNFVNRFREEFTATEGTDI